MSKELKQNRKSRAGSPSLDSRPLRKRPNLTIRLTAEMYVQIQAAADRAGRSLSEEVERRLETAAEWNAVFESVAAFKTRYEADCAALERGDTEEVLPRRGYMKVYDARLSGGYVWAPPGSHISSNQIYDQLEWNEFQAAKKAKEEAAKTERPQQLEELTRLLLAELRRADRGKS